MVENANKLEDIKLVISGLDNAGKTSFLIALRQKYNFYEKVKNLKPTIKVDYSACTFLNKWTVNVWDMGGQEKYRQIYINNPFYFEETNYLYFIIDIQDEYKIEESVQYLSELLKIYREIKYSNEIIVCFNKFDPKFREDKECFERVEMIKNLIISQNNDLKFKFFTTSIYDVSSLSRAISYSLNKLLRLDKLNSRLKSLVEDHECNHALVYTNAGLIISDYYKETMNMREFNEAIYSKISDDLEFFQRLADEKVHIDERLTFSKNSTEYVKKYDVHTANGLNRFYIGVSAPPKKIQALKVELDALKNDFESLLK